MFEPDPQIVRLRKYADEIASAYEQGPRNWMGQFLLAFFIVVGDYNISLILVVPALAYLAITVVALISIANRALVRDDPPDLVCPDCKSRTPLLSQWTCGKCFHDHIPANPPPSLPLYPPVPTFVQRCAFCRFLPHSLACFNCYRPIIFNRREYQEDRNTISFLTDYPPPPPTPKEEPKPPTIDDFIRPGARTQHTYIVGATGSGKTELLKLLIRSYFDKPCAVVVMDPAGDLAEQVARWPTDRLIYVAHDLELGQTPTINPFEIQDVAATDTSPRALNTKTVVAQQLLAAFQEVIGKGERGDFTTNMEAILEPCIVALLDREGTTIRDLQRFMDDNRNADLIAFGRSLAHYPDTANFFEHHFHHRHYHTTKAAILTKFQTLFSTGRFPALTCGESTIRLERAWEQKKIIVFNLAKGMLGDKESSAFGRLIVALLQGIAVRRASIPEEKRIPCTSSSTRRTTTSARR